MLRMCVVSVLCVVSDLSCSFSILFNEIMFCLVLLVLLVLLVVLCRGALLCVLYRVHGVIHLQHHSALELLECNVWFFWCKSRIQFRNITFNASFNCEYC